LYAQKKNEIVTVRHVSVPQNILKMHLRPRLRPGPRWGSLQRSPRPLVGFGGGERKEVESEREGKRRGGKGGEGVRVALSSRNGRPGFATGRINRLHVALRRNDMVGCRLSYQ